MTKFGVKRDMRLAPSNINWQSITIEFYNKYELVGFLVVTETILFSLFFGTL
jgi:hypothetical protein